MLHALFAVILIPAGLDALNFRSPYDPCGHLDGALSPFISVVLCVTVALHLPMCVYEGGLVLYA